MPSTVEDALGRTTGATVAIIVVIAEQIAAATTELETCFRGHPDAAIYLSIPGIGVVVGARVLGEFGDNPNRYADSKSRRNYAGTSPIARELGVSRIVKARWRRNRRLYDAINSWAFSPCNTSPGARALYKHRRAQRDSHHKALRTVANRLVSILDGCLTHRALYDEDTAWAHRTPTEIDKAA